MFEMFKNELRFLAYVGYRSLCELAIAEALREGRVTSDEARELEVMVKEVAGR